MALKVNCINGHVIRIMKCFYALTGNRSQFLRESYLTSCNQPNASKTHTICVNRTINCNLNLVRAFYLE